MYTGARVRISLPQVGVSRESIRSRTTSGPLRRERDGRAELWRVSRTSSTDIYLYAHLAAGSSYMASNGDT